MTEFNEEVVSTTLAALQTLVNDAKRLGLTWTLRPATVTRATTTANASNTVSVIQDGDSAVLLATNLMSRQRMLINDRVMTLMVPPGGIFVIGSLGGGAGGYLLGEQVIITGSGTFTKANYRGIRAIGVEGVGGGGSGGGCALTGAGAASVGSNAASGSYSYGFFLAQDVPDSVTVTVGTGGTAAAAGSAGNNGTDTTFGSLLTAVLGGAGQAGPATAATASTTGGNAGTGTVSALALRSLVLPGNAGANGLVGAGLVLTNDNTTPSPGSYGTFNRNSTTDAGANGATGGIYGGGGSGGFNQVSQGTAKAGGAGADGIVVVQIYY